MMTVQGWLDAAEVELKAAHVETARLDCLVLLEDALDRGRAWILAHPEEELHGPTVTKLDAKIAQRAKHTPLAYIRYKSEFYGREFIISDLVLQPRPETETMIELLKAHVPRPQPPTNMVLVDVGTGSGALAITAMLELHGIKAIAIDIDQRCLEIARQNAAKYNVGLTLIRSNLLDKLRPRDDQELVLLCNLPYVPTEHPVNTAATYEPELALFGGADGLDLYRKLFRQVSNFSNKPSHIFCESLPTQHEALAAIAKAVGYTQLQTDDFIQLFVPKV